MPSQKKNASPYDSRHRANLTKYKKQIDRLFDTLCQEAARLGIRTGLEEDGGTFSFDRFPTARKKADRLLARIRQQMESAIVSGTSNEWALSEAKNAEIIEKLLEDTDIPRETIEAMKPRNADALKAFQERRKRGLTLSDRVWNVTSQAMGEVETAIGISIATGMDAPSLSRKVRGLLNNPTEMWRRYYVTRTRTDGTRQREAEWRRKVVDEDGKVRFVKQPLSHPGRGVYRSSYRNALRLAVTETNMAYHEADTLAWQHSPACIGIEVALSNNHTCRGVKGVFYDICDELAGKYPKYFKFPGWHPFCRCVAIPITASKEEFVGYLKDMMADKDVSGMKFKGTVKDMPDAWNSWTKKNSDRIERMKERGTLPYFIKINEGRMAAQMQSVTKYKDDEWKLSYVPKLGNGFVMTERVRIKESMASKSERQKFEKEMHMCRVLADNGHGIEYLQGTGRPKGQTYDITMNGMKADLKCVTGGTGNIVKYIKKALIKQGGDAVVLELPSPDKKYFEALAEARRKCAGRIFFYIKGENVVKEAK